MKEFFEVVFSSIMGIVLFVLVIFGLSYGGYKSYEFFAPKYRHVDAEVFKQSEQYNDGMIRDLENLQMQYMDADQAHKDALRSIVLHRFSVYDQNRLPTNLWNFYQQLKAGKI
jgi:hypothetical protein